jgi:hypothetical protein
VMGPGPKIFMRKMWPGREALGLVSGGSKRDSGGDQIAAMERISKQFFFAWGSGYRADNDTKGGNHLLIVAK